MYTGLTDIHCHLLPGVDDGPSDLEAALEMARVASADGTRRVVATPHVRRDFLTDVSTLPDRVLEIVARLREEGIALEVGCGGELGHDMVWSLGRGDLETIAQGPPGARWQLVETPFEGIDEEVCLACEELRQQGFGVVLAHPERSAGLLGEARRLLDRELAAGTALQVNVWSLAGGYGAAIEATARRLVRDGLAQVLASDAHPGWRAPTLSVGVERAELAGLATAEAARLVTGRPATLLDRGLVPRDPAVQPGLLREAPSSR